MRLARGSFGIVHSVLGGSDGVSIVARQSVDALRGPLGVPPGRVRLLAGEVGGGLEADAAPALSQRDPANLRIRAEFSSAPSPALRGVIESGIGRSRAAVEEFVRERDIGLLLVHNSCHPTNFLMGAGLGRYLETALPRPRCVLWWHDSHLERERYSRPNPVVADYLRYLPGTVLDGIVFINSGQPALAQRYLARMGMRDAEGFIRDRCAVIPNTFGIDWDWRSQAGALPEPPAGPDDAEFLEAVGAAAALRAKGHRLEDALILLQHTRVVPRKRIDLAVDLAVELASLPESGRRPVLLLVSGHAGDERGDAAGAVREHLEARLQEDRRCRDRVFLVFAQEHISPERSGTGERRRFRFMDVPKIVARRGGLGTFFSELEGFGNNLLEMLGSGLPAVVNRYPVFRTDIEPLGFDLPACDGTLTPALVRESWALLSDPARRRRAVLRNLEILSEKLHHGVLASRLGALLEKVQS